MRILYVGFKGRHNPSCQLVSLLPGEKLFLTNSFPGLNRDIANIPETYDAVCMFGIDKTLANSVRIETCAEIAHHRLYTSLDPAQLQTTLAANGIPSALSQTPTRFLCNEAYYRMLSKTGGNAIFLHIPGLKNMTGDTMDRLLASFS